MRRLAAITAAMVIAVATAAGADTITLTGGGISYSSDGIESFNLQGADFSASGGFTGNFVTGFDSGQLVSLSADNTVNGSFAWGGASVNGTMVPASPVWFTGFLNVHGDPFVAPTPATPPPDNGSVFASFTTPAVLDGALNGFGSPDHSGPPLFSVTFTSPGTAAETFRELPNSDGTTTYFGGPSGNGVFRAEAASVSPTPEPASLLLVGGGLAAAFARRRR